MLVHRRGLAAPGCPPRCGLGAVRRWLSRTLPAAGTGLGHFELQPLFEPVSGAGPRVRVAGPFHSHV